MSTVPTSPIRSVSLGDTLKFAEQIGRKLRGGEVIELRSDIGGGKTSFVKGLARGMGSHDLVHSPSFTLANEYHSSKLTLYHLDLYRLAEPGIMRTEIAELMSDEQAVVVVEWADIIKDVLPEDHLQITITTTGQTDRVLSLQAGLKHNHLLPQNT